MLIKELKRELAKFDDEALVIISSDEELNTLFEKFEVAELEDVKEGKEVVIYGLSGSEFKKIK